MEPALKQRLIGAIVLVAIAVIFLPMLIKGPAPESGVGDIPLDMPDAPAGEFETRELPLVTPGTAPEGGVVGMPSGERLPTVDTRQPAADGTVDDASALPATTAAGDYALNFGTYASSRDAERVIKALAAKGLSGFQDTVDGKDSRTLYRVRIGPYDSREAAEAARLVATGVNPQIDVRVVVLNADAAELATPVAASPVSNPEPLPETPVAAKPEPAKPAPVAATPAPTPAPKPAETAPARAAAPDVGFAVQLAAFSHAEEATKLRDRARAAGFSAFIETVNTDKGTLSRVRVGPVADRAQAEALKAQVAAKLGVNGFVQSHP